MKRSRAVNVLCMDKTGTITDGRVYVSDILPIDLKADVGMILKETILAIGDTNHTALAIKGKFPGDAVWQAEAIVPFSPIRKWSGATFPGKGSFFLGAPEVLMQNMREDTTALRGLLQKYADAGVRTLLLAKSAERLMSKNSSEANIPGDIEALALLVLEDFIREEAEKIFRFFQQEGVDIKIISGG